jgi:glyoxylate reductase
LDVYEHEPAVSSELLALPNVVLSPHTGTGTWEGRIAMCENVTDNILAFYAGETDKMNIVL